MSIILMTALLALLVLALAGHARRQAAGRSRRMGDTTGYAWLPGSNGGGDCDGGSAGSDGGCDGGGGGGGGGGE